ncbi:hypothetical protein BJF78_17780 [Pseudonocardia sp. CNS-139]|nr:hypothetical protein BJF78_17780 [Pseudonocardia sp. CNS-139]
MSAVTALRGPVLAGVVGKAAEAGTLVLLATLVPRLLGPADYGTFSVATTVVAIGSMALTLGGATLLSRYVPAAAPDERTAVAVALTLRLARNRFALLGALAVAAVGLAVLVPDRFPPAVTGLVLLAVALNVAGTLLLQADLGTGRALAWCFRYPVQNAVLVAAVLALHGTAAEAGGGTAVALAGLAGLAVGIVAAAPLVRPWPPRVPVPEGALRFGVLQAAGGALTQLVQRGAVLAVALLAGSAVETGYAALAMGIALAATYAVTQLFTVSLPALAAGDTAGSESALRRLAGGLLAGAFAVAAGGVVALDVLVPLGFGTAYADAVPAFGPALALVVLAPVTALAVQAAALRTQPAATLWSSAAGAARSSWSRRSPCPCGARRGRPAPRWPAPPSPRSSRPDAAGRGRAGAHRLVDGRRGRRHRSGGAPVTAPEPPRISVVVPTRDRPDRLVRCLAALDRQTVPGLEIVVVDDASRDTLAVVRAVATAPRARLVRGEGRGPAAARNAGVAAARAPLVCFTDDDCEPVPEWAAALAATVEHGADAAAGPTRNGRPDSVFAAAAQAIATHLAEATIDPATSAMRFAPTSNLACRADVCREIPFDERYPLAAGEDRDWCARLLAAGRTLVFAPDALVRHHQELDATGFWRQQVRYGRGAYRFRSDHGTLRRLEAPAFYAGLVRRGLADGVRAGALVCVAQAATAVGMAMEATRRV